jgi:probable HAF family extracellular repeat protein
MPNERWTVSLLVTLATMACGSPDHTDSQLSGTPVQVTGFSETASGEIHSFLWQNGQMTDLGTLGGTNSWATGINDQGQVVGYSENAGCCGILPDFDSYHFDTHAFLWEDGEMVDLGAFGSGQSWAMGVNDHGQVVGVSPDSAGDYRAVLWEHGEMHDLSEVACGQVGIAINDQGAVVGQFLCRDGKRTDLGTLGDEELLAWAINDMGQIVGEAFTATGERHAFLWQDGELIDLGTALCGGNECDAEASGINNLGQIVGYMGPVSGTSRAFLWMNGETTDLGTLGGEASSASAINDCGQVVGSSETVTGARHAYLWQNGEMIDLGTLGGRHSSAKGVNECTREAG